MCVEEAAGVMARKCDAAGVENATQLVELDLSGNREFDGAAMGELVGAAEGTAAGVPGRRLTRRVS